MTEKKMFRGKCRMCGSTYIFEEVPPAMMTFFAENKHFHAPLCYRCGIRIIEFIKAERQKRKWQNMIV